MIATSIGQDLMKIEKHVRMECPIFQMMNMMIKNIVSFFEIVGTDAKEMMINNPDIPKDTRVIILRVWSNGFEAHNVKSSNKFNSLQVFTVKLMGPKDQTLPFSLCFKTFNVQEILVNLLEELLEL